MVSFLAALKKITVMKIYTYLIILLVIASSCNQQTAKNDTEEKLAQLTKQNDSLKQELENKRAEPIKEPEEAEKTPNKRIDKEGTHPISLQWIGWDKPGSATISPMEDGWYSINGSQQNKNGDYLKIEGQIRRLSAKELQFDGIIETKVSYNNGGEVCIKKGKQSFYAKGDRKYFRLQNMENCAGGRLVDYVDIYEGTSGL